MQEIKMEKYSWQFVSKAAEPLLHIIEWDTPDIVTPGYTVGPVVRRLYLVECNVSGYGTVNINGKEFCVGPGDCYVIYPGDTVIQKADDKDPRIALWCLFGGARVGEILRASGITSDAPFAPKEKFGELLAIMKKLLAISNKTGMGAELMKTACLYEFLGALADGKEDISRNIIAERAISIMETEYSGSLSVSDIARELSFDRSYFSTLFKESVGTSPYSYLTRIRIRRACDLLRDTPLSVGAISERVGITPHNFSRIFKREVGISPAEYRRRNPD